VKRAVALALLLVACGGDDGPSRADAMAAVADFAVPRFESFASAASEATGAVEAACAEPTEETVAAAREQVDTARQRWLETRAVWTGPVMDRRSAGLVDWSPDPEGVTALVEGDEAAELTPETIAGSVGADVRGLGSLYGVLARDDAVELLADPRWCAYATSVATTVHDEATAIERAWTAGADGEPAFAEVITDDDVAQDWLAMFVDDDIQLVRLLGRPLPEDAAEASPDPFRDRALQLGGVGDVFAALAGLIDDDVDATVAEQLAAAGEALRAGDLDVAHQRLEEVDRTLSTDVAGQLDVTIGFSDADGDGSG
jgi:predicted lipoprotein